MNIRDKDFLFKEFGVSGREEKIRESIERFGRKFVDEMFHDVTGSLICIKRGTDKNRKKIMLSAHMDTIGFVVTYIDESGFFRFAEVGDHPEAYLLGKRVLFENGTIGVVGVEKKEYARKLNKEKMFIDIGAESKKDAGRRVRIGDMCAVYSPYTVTDRIITGGWMNDRIGCLILLEVMENIKLTPNDIIFVFSAQEEVGIRGVKTATYEIEPDIGIVVDVTESSADLPEGELSGSCVLGKGAGIKVMDRKIIVPKMLIDHLTSLAGKNKIPHQRDIMQSSGTGAQGIQLSRGGVLAGGISVPVRYMHSACEMCALHDIQACKDLIKAFCVNKIRI
jgi:endoglucanase